MRRITRRRLDMLWLLLGALLVGAGSAIAALLGDTERIGNYWMHAALDVDGRATVVEVIDYDFGPRSRRGILRNVPDVDPAAAIVVSSPTAPDDLKVTSGFGEVRLRIGNPDITISNRHRYRIEYPIDSLVVGDRVAWDAIGFEWTVGIDNAEIHLTTPHQLDDLDCAKSKDAGGLGGCTVEQIAPGHLLVEVSRVSSGEAVTIFATRRGALASGPLAPVEPTGPASDPGSGWLPPLLAGAAGALAGAGVTSLVIQRLGREQVWKGGAADAAFGPRPGEDVGTRLLDHAELAEMATIEFESPRGLSASAGGIVHRERVESRHQIAWLIECAIRNEVVLEGTDHALTLVRGPATPHPVVAPTLDRMFAGRTQIRLGAYDEAFAFGWKGLERELQQWRQASGLWDPTGHQRRNVFRVWGLGSAAIGLVAAVIGSIVANRGGLEWIPIVAVGGLVAGGGVAAFVRSWELPIRTPEGSSRWLQIESFRRFIAASEARHAEAAAQRGLLRHYTAWAVALDELDHWESAVEAAAAVPGSAVRSASSDLRFVSAAPGLSSATSRASTAPSSSGGGWGGGGGGGGAGGGGGGGGGGGW